MLQVNNVTHWSIPVNNLEEAEHFYRDVLGLWNTRAVSATPTWPA